MASNSNLNAPWWWKRLESALIFLLTSMITLVGLSKSLSPNATHDITLIYLPGAIVFIKSVGIFFMGIPPDVPGNSDVQKIMPEPPPPGK